MAVWGEVELEPEVEAWWRLLGTAASAHAAYIFDLLADEGPALKKPYTRKLRGKLRELRFYVAGEPTRVTYYVAAGRRIILLTVFRKTQRREISEIERAYRAMLTCIEQRHDTED
jgi:hypothetical protein